MLPTEFTMSDRTHLELAIGGERTYKDGRVLTAKPITAGYCAGCVFSNENHPRSCVDVWDQLGECGSSWRNDGRSIVFVDTNEESEDLGEFSF
jgi:hypothetical protein